MLSEARLLLQLLNGGWRVLSEMRLLLHLLDDWRDRRPGCGEMSAPRSEQRELAEKMRALPGRYAERLSSGASARITVLAGAGQWEKAVEQLIASLCSRSQAITGTERGDLHTLAGALNLPAERIDALPSNP